MSGIVHSDITSHEAHLIHGKFIQFSGLRKLILKVIAIISNYQIQETLHIAIVAIEIPL